MAEVKRLLADQRLLTLTGPGGCGKTRLALAVGHELVEEFEDGVWLVELASLSDPALVAQTVAFTLGVREQPGRPLTETLTDYLRPREVLLVLDNCEHLVEACANLAVALLRACPRLRILATSRETLGIAGETPWLVPSLSLPAGRQPPAIEEMPRYEAVRLFIERTTAVLPGFALTDRNAQAVAQVCQRLDGIPLAIELAAARARVLAVEQIAARLDGCFRLLAAGSRTALPRHQTLRATMDWSHELLSEEERALFRRLSVLAGGFTLEAVEAVCAGEGIEEEEVLDLLSHLVDKSLVVVQERGGEARYRLLETVRQYGNEKLLESEAAEAIRRRHASFFLALAEEAEPKLKGAQSRLWLERLEIEFDNLRAALRWAADAGEVETLLRLAGALWWFWLRNGHLSEGRRWLEGALERVEATARTAARAKVLWGAGFLAFSQVSHPAARSRLEESAGICREIGDRRGLAYALSFLSLVMAHQGVPAEARPLAEEGVRLFREDGGDRWGLAIALTNMGVVAEAQADYELAIPLFEESATILRELGDRWPLSIPLRHLGIVAYRHGDHLRAEGLYKESLASLRELGEKWLISLCLEELAGVACAQGKHARAARLWGAEETICEAIGATVRALYRADYERGVAAARAGLGEKAFEAEWAQGRAMTLEGAIAYALDEPTTTPQQEEDAPSPAAQTASAETKAPPELRIFALGPARVYRGEEALASSEWTYAKSRELLFYLLGHPSRTKAQIGLDLWPEASPSQLRSTFHNVLHHLRQALGRPEWVLFEKGRYAFNRSLNYFYDVEAFESKLAQARRVEDEAPAQAISHLKEAVELYGGDFLQDCAESEWAFVRQEELRRTYQEALIELGRLLFAEDRYAEAVEAYRRLIGHDALLEEAHRELMRCQARLGERSRALRHYRDLVELLRKELGSSPAPETTKLYERLRRGEDI
jgi:non-specific serine/threonine protein kinase